MTQAGDYTLVNQGDRWELTVTVLGYTDPHTPAHPWVHEDTVKSRDPSLGEYETELVNFLHEDKNNEGRLYNADVSISTITDSRTLEFIKIWEDGNADNSIRPNVRYRLYRYSASTNIPAGYSMFECMSPVRGMDSMSINTASWEDTDNQWDIVYTVDGVSELPRYDGRGYKYLYIIKEDIQYTASTVGTYQLVTADGEAVAYYTSDGRVWNSKGQVLPNDGKLYNRRTGSVSVPFTKEWRAKAMQSMDTTVQFGVIRRLKDSEDDWTLVRDAKDQPLSIEMSFAAEYLTKDNSFNGLPRYDEEGYEYEYKTVECSMVINGYSVLPQGEWFEPGETYESEGKLYRVWVGEEDGIMINTLQQNAVVEIEKNWSPVLPADTEASITVIINQSGTTLDLEALVAAGTVTLPEGATVSGTDLTLPMTADGTTARFDFTVLGLPQYDTDGSEYVYLITETGCVPSEYSVGRCSYANRRSAENQQLTVHRVLNNYHGGSGGWLYFDVCKVWNDDGDVSSRGPVKYEIYYKPENDVVLTGTVTEADQWYKEVDIDVRAWPVGSDRRDPSNYEIREISVRGCAVHATEETFGGIHYPRIVKTAGSANGFVGQVYAVEEHCDDPVGSTRRMVMTNTRVGDVSFELTKKWNTGDMLGMSNQNGLVAEYQLKRNGVPMANPETENGLYPMEAYHYTEGGSRTTKLTVPSLPKYDAKGRIYKYSLEEAALNGNDFNDRGVIVCEEGFQVVSSRQDGVYDIGENRTGDVMHYTFTNTRRESEPLTVYKLWRDDGTGTVRRPDFILTLYRKGFGAVAVSKQITDNTWNTTRNWLWSCDFGSFPLYDDNGFAYEYYVKETLVGNSGYAGYYYTEPNAVLNRDGANTIEVMKDAGHLTPIAGSDGVQVVVADSEHVARLQTGVVVNRLEQTATMTVTKLWKKIPDWFNKADYPTIYVNIECAFGEPRADWQAREALPADTPLTAANNYTMKAVVNSTDEYGIPFTSFRLVEKANPGTGVMLSGFTS